MATVPLDHLCDRYHMPMDAVRNLYDALCRTRGMLAQFNHPSLGGQGQWMPGMCQIGDMWNDQLKAQVSGLCAELSALVQGTESQADQALTADPAGPSWWPAALGTPSTSGAQNGIRYAYFPEHRRLAVQMGGGITIYNTGRHKIQGVSQQQGSSSTLRFTSQLGEVALDALKVVPH